jgi:hypothetical protein
MVHLVSSKNGSSSVSLSSAPSPSPTFSDGGFRRRRPPFALASPVVAPRRHHFLRDLSVTEDFVVVDCEEEKEAR